MSTKIIRPNLSTDTYKVEGNQFTKITSCNNESITGETYAFPHGDIELMSVLGEKIFICPNYRTVWEGIYDEDIKNYVWLVSLRTSVAITCMTDDMSTDGEFAVVVSDKRYGCAPTFEVFCTYGDDLLYSQWYRLTKNRSGGDVISVYEPEIIDVSTIDPKSRCIGPNGDVFAHLGKRILRYIDAPKEKYQCYAAMSIFEKEIAHMQFLDNMVVLCATDGSIHFGPSLHRFNDSQEHVNMPLLAFTTLTNAEHKSFLIIVDKFNEVYVITRPMTNTFKFQTLHEALNSLNL